MNKARILIAVICVGLLSIGCDKIPILAKKALKSETKNMTPVSGKIVATIGNFNISAEDLNKEVDDYNKILEANRMASGKIDTKEKKLTYLRNELIRKYMLYQEALDRGMDKNEEINRILEKEKVDLLVAELVRTELKKIEVSSKEIEDFYSENKELLKEPEQRKILEIVTETEDQAKQVYIELLKGTDFGALARQYSKAPTAANGGDVGFLALDPDPKKRTKFDKFYEAGFAPSLEAGGISNIFKGPDGFYIIKLDSIKKSETKSLSELWDNIKSWLLFEKQQKAIKDLADKLAGETKVQVYEEKVE